MKELEELITKITSRHIARAFKSLENFDIPHEERKAVSSEFWNMKDDIIEILKVSDAMKLSQGDNKGGQSTT